MPAFSELARTVVELIVRSLEIMRESRGAESQALLLTDLKILTASSNFLVSKMKIPIVVATKIKIICRSLTVMKKSMTVDYFQVYFGNENIWYM